MKNLIYFCIGVVLLTACAPFPVRAQAGTAAPSGTVTPSSTYSPTPAALLPSGTPSPTSVRDVCVVAGGSVNVRAGSGMNTQVVDVVYQGESLITWGTTINGWRRVATPRLVEGWFYMEWCK